MRSRAVAMAGPSGPSASRNSLMICTSRVCTRRVPPEPMRVLPTALLTSVRRRTASMMSLSRRLISSRYFSISDELRGSSVPVGVRTSNAAMRSSFMRSILPKG